MGKRSPLCLPGTPYMVHSVVRFQTWKGPCCDIVRVADSAVKTIGFRDNLIDLSAVRAFLGSGQGKISQWYDQTGNSCHLVQATSANQPSILAANAIGGALPISVDSIPDDVGALAKNLTVTGISLSTQAVSVFQVINPNTSFNQSVFWQLMTSAPEEALNLYVYGHTVSAEVFGLTTYQSTPGTQFNSGFSPRASQPTVLGLVSGAADASHYMDGASVAKGSAFAAQTATSMNLGPNYFDVQGYGNYDIFANIVYASALSAGDSGLVNSACQQAFPILRQSASPVLVVLDGHSFTTGFGATFNQNLGRFLQKYLHRPVRFKSIGVYGQLASTIDSLFASNSATTYDASRYCIYMIIAGCNDITAGATGTAAYNSVKSCCTKAKAAGFNKTVVVSCSYQQAQTPTNKTGFDLFNTLCAAGAGTDFDVFANTMADARINTVAAMSDTTISGDGIHFTSLGQLYEVQTLAPAIGGVIPF